ncbi:hypothetical protein [Cohnella zeiphila]|uniref:Uncharacterized protein n=1 Tax=Cohnella zeiphila TaxID=2761120 RepID=A0A7X0SPN8_9BACL|nr:hypothetical protein [Cohnella zeiphila]MBB6733877.1 hypothetical protein [Cohnella zeiphila]
MKRRFIAWAVLLPMLMLLSPLQAWAAGGSAAAGTGSETLLYQVNGTLSDFDQSRVLWTETGNHALWLIDRKDGSQIKVFDAGGSGTVDQAKLTAQGVVFASAGSARYWENGTVRELGVSQRLNAAKGNFAVFSSVVVDLGTGRIRSLPNSGFQNANRFDLAADGTVVYTDSTYTSKLYQSLADGTLTAWVPPNPPYTAYSGVLTDGTNLIYRVLKYTSSGEKWSLRFRDGAGQATELALNPFLGDYFDNSKQAFQIRNGWVAYKAYDKDKGHWILYVRSPEGPTRQVYEGPSSWSVMDIFRRLSLNELGADGSVVFTADNVAYYASAQTNGLVRLPGSSGEYRYLEHVVGGPGGTEYRLGAWYRLSGDSLYGVQV